MPYVSKIIGYIFFKVVKRFQGYNTQKKKSALGKNIQIQYIW